MRARQAIAALAKTIETLCQLDPDQEVPADVLRNVFQEYGLPRYSARIPADVQWVVTEGNPPHLIGDNLLGVRLGDQPSDPTYIFYGEARGMPVFEVKVRPVEVREFGDSIRPFDR
jgi:hypothetical protein